MAEHAADRNWQRLIRTAVREAWETWCLQGQAGPVTEKAFEAILNRAALPILRRLQDQPPEVVAVLVPTLVRAMLAAAVELMAERGGRETVSRETALGSAP